MRYTIALLFATHVAWAGELTITAADAGKTYKLQAGDRFRVVLDTNPSTGYAWYFLKGPQIFSLLSDMVQPPRPQPRGEAPRAGVPTRHIFNFVANRVGASDVRIVSGRAYGPDLDWQNMFRVTIEVEPTTGGRPSKKRK